MSIYNVMCYCNFMALLCSLLLAACANNNRYDLDADIAPQDPINLDHIEPITPKYESYSLQGNNNYILHSKHYEIIRDPKGFVETGIASWYGSKFHGHLTSNGEVYDMYSISAAHKNLPLPSFVKVTNLDNQKDLIVRINDRGPFHDGRIIDLSYAAAHKLGVLATGTANVTIEALTFDKHTNASIYSIQVMSSPHKSKIDDLANSISQHFNLPYAITISGKIYSLHLGSFDNYFAAQTMLTTVKQTHKDAFIKKHTNTFNK